jgi:hypothetical protein
MDPLLWTMSFLTLSTLLFAVIATIHDHKMVEKKQKLHSPEDADKDARMFAKFVSERLAQDWNSPGD